MTFCCKKMELQSLELKRDEKEKNHNVTYDQCWREYTIGFIYYDSDAASDMACEIHYCPWCGSKLPSSLAKKWFEVLKEEYGIEDPPDEDRDRVPLEFRTDEWWKKRGL
ncbi:MAG: DUF6980 family protein [Rickettsiales bacterium]